jgi:hypothetical protein
VLGRQCAAKHSAAKRQAAFVVIGSTDPEGSRPYIGALLLAYYDPDGRLVYAGRVGRHQHRRAPTAVAAATSPRYGHNMPLDLPPPRSNRFGSPPCPSNQKPFQWKKALRLIIN